jgi:hypothetical protein
VGISEVRLLRERLSLTDHTIGVGLRGAPTSNHRRDYECVARIREQNDGLAHIVPT